MEIASFVAEAKVRILIGKGGVGKTTVTCALAAALAGEGFSVLLVELEGRPDVAQAFGRSGELPFEPVLLQETSSGGRVEGRQLPPNEVLVEYLADHGLGRISKRLASSGILDVVASAIPGIRDILVLGKIKQLSNESAADVVLVDAPATGHAVTLLTSAAGLADVARSGRVRRQADEVIDMLSDPSRCQVTLVTIPEELPVTEAIEAAFLVEDRAGVALGPLIANRVDRAAPALATPARSAAQKASLDIDLATLDALDQAARFQRHRAGVADEALNRLRTELPLSVIELPRVASAVIGPSELDELAIALRAGLLRLGSVE